MKICLYLESFGYTLEPGSPIFSINNQTEYVNSKPSRSLTDLKIGIEFAFFGSWYIRNADVPFLIPLTNIGFLDGDNNQVTNLEPKRIAITKTIMINTKKQTFATNELEYKKSVVPLTILLFLNLDIICEVPTWAFAKPFPKSDIGLL